MRTSVSVSSVFLFLKRWCLLVLWLGTQAVPTHAANLQIPVGDSHNCVVISDGSVQCWGNNVNGQLGNGNSTQSLFPMEVKGLRGAKAISTGYYHTCVVLDNGSVSCWGSNQSGQLGRGTTTGISVFDGSSVVSNAVSLSAGGFHTCAVLADGTVKCWGENSNGQLGDGTLVNSTVPVSVADIRDAVTVSAGTYHTCAVLRTGGVQCWGSNDTGQLGYGRVGGDLSKPVTVSGIIDATALATGRNHSCAITGTGVVQCWGSDIFGQLGNGTPAAIDVITAITTTTTIASSPVVVQGILKAKTIEAGANHTCAITGMGAMQCWGANKYGQLGNGGSTDSPIPVTMNEVSNVLAVMTGYYHSCAVLADGGVKCAGENTYGQLGSGNTDSLVAKAVMNPAASIPFSWKLPAKPSALNLSGSTLLQASGSTLLVAKVSYSDNTVKPTPVIWRSSNPLAATVSPAGMLTAGAVKTDTPVTLTATFTENGVTVQSTIQVTITATPMALTDLQFVGMKTSVQSKGQMRLVLNATYSDGSIKPVLASSYALSNNALGQVNLARGVLNLESVTTDTPLTITATYTERGVTKTTSASMTIVAATATLSRMTLVGTQATLMAGHSIDLSAQGLYSDGSRKVVSATWKLVGTAATISSTGTLVAKDVTKDTPVTVTASYTNPLGVTVEAEYVILIQPMTSQTPSYVAPIRAEVEATGLRSDFGLAFWSTLDLSTATSTATRSSIAPRTTTTTSSGYNMYIAALVPGGSLVTTSTLFFLNRSAQWQLASFPLPEYLSGVSDNSTQWVELFDHLDSNLITGTQFFVGYGTSDTEMVESGRFQMVYQLQ